MSDNSKVYENFLEYRKKGNTWTWVSRELNLQVAYNQKKVITPEYHKEAVLKSPKVQELLNKICNNQQITKANLEKQVKQLLEEIGYKKNWKLTRWLGLVLTKICLTVSSGIYVNMYKVQEIRSIMGNCPVVFIPSHRSYIDFILMSYICFGYDIAIPAIAAGMDFQGMVGMGSVLRNTGAFFMRRSYNDDDMYWTTFKQYVYQIITEGDLPIEFFIEGTRSRSNKSLTPKYGILAMIMKAFFFAQVPDVLFVPINISYDRIFEETLFAYELLGVPKPKESTSGFFKSLKILKENFGNIYYTFNDCISAKDFYADKLDRTSHSRGPLHLQELTPYEKSLLPPLAHEIICKQQKSAVTTVFNLMATIINHYLSNRQKIRIDDLLKEVEWLRYVVKMFGGFVHTETLENSIREAFNVHSNLIKLSNNNEIEFVKGNIKQGDINPRILKAHALSDETMTKSLPFIMLQIYVNPVLQYFVDGAILIIILRKCEGSTKDDIYANYHFLRTLYILEFVTYEPKINEEFEKSLSKLISMDAVKLDQDCYSLGTNHKLQEILLTSMKPFLYSYSVVLAVLKILPDESDEKSILSNSQMFIENEIMQDCNFVHPYCFNLDTLGNCLGNLVSLGILKKNRRNNKNIYISDKLKIAQIQQKLGALSSSPVVPDKLTISIHQQNKL